MAGTDPPQEDVAPSTWLVPAVASVLCCLPLTGVVAVYYGAQVRPYWESGQFARARMMSRRARAWVLLTWVLFVVLVGYGVASGTLGETVARLRP